MSIESFRRTDLLEGLYHVVFQEKQDPAEASKGLTHTYELQKQNLKKAPGRYFEDL